MTGFLLLLGLLGLTLVSAEAHTVIDVGDYSIIVGWEIEPPIVGERNVMYIDLLRDGQLVAAKDSALSLQLQYGDVTKGVIPTQDPQTGRYRVTFIPTVAGEYAFKVSGTAGDQAIDVVVTPERVEEPIALQFPAIALTNVELQTAIERMEASNAATRQALLLPNGLATAAIVLTLLLAVYLIRFRLPRD